MNRLRLALFLLLLIPTAHAHALLADATPPPNSRVDTAPDTLVLKFTERVESTYTDISVQGVGGEYARSLTIGPDDRRQVTVTLYPMEDGIYTVRWKTLSSADGHTRSDSYLLAVNRTLAGAVDPSQAETAPPTLWWEPVARALGFLATSLLVGIPLFTAWTKRDDPRFPRLALAGGVAAAASATLLLGAIAIRTGVADTALLQTRQGGLLVARIALGIAAALAATRSTKAAMALGVLLTALTSIGGHAAAGGPGAIPVDILHQLFVAAWLGGVAGLAILRPDGPIIRRFSTLAMVSVAGIALTGLLSTFDRLGDLSTLGNAGYPRLIVWKLVLMVPLLALGAFHAWTAAGRRAITHGRSLMAELGLMVVVLLLSGALASTAPAAPPTGPEPDGHLENKDLVLDIFITPQPPTIGIQDFIVHVAAKNPAIDLDLMHVFMTPIGPSAEGEGKPSEGHSLSDGQWHFGGPIFTEPGRWELRLTAQGSGFLSGSVFVDVAPA